MKTVLVVSYHYGPEEGSCSQKNDRIVKSLLDNDFNVIVLTKGYSDLPLIYSNEQITIVRTENNGLFHKRQSSKATIGSGIAKTGDIKRKIKTYVSNSLVPDSVIDWLPEVKRCYIKNKTLFENVDIILSISSPYSAHLCSEFLSDNLKKPFVMCYGDPWIYESKRKRGKIRLSYEKKIEKRLLDKAKKVLLITEWNRKKYNEIYQIPLSKISTYNIGYDMSECIYDIASNDSDDLNIIYGGSLDSVHRNPEPFIEAMSHVKGVKAYIYNSDAPNLEKLVKNYNIEDRVILNPIISSKEFYKELHKMDALLLFGNKTPFQIPGKVFTYISTKKTILYIKNNEFEDDGTEIILNDFGNAVVVKNEVQHIVNSLQQIKNYRNFSENINIDKFEFHNTMASVIDAINEVLN